MKILKAIANRLFIILLALDQLICGVIWLRPDHTISGEVGYAALNGKRWGLVVERCIDAMPWFGRGHCRNSIEWDEVNQPPFSLWR
jgi:hypothetical protein